MADNTELNPGSGGDIIATDDVTIATSTIKFQRVKLALGADGIYDSDVHSSNPMPVTLVANSTTQPVSGTVTANLGTISSVATQATLAQVTTFTQSTNTILAQPLSSNTFRVTIAVDDVGIGGGTQYVEGNTSTAPTGTVMLWKSAVSTLSAASTSNPLPVAGTLLQNVTTFTNSTNTLLVNLSSNSASSNALLSTIAARVLLTSSLGLQATLAQVTTYTKSTADMVGGALASTGALWVQSIPGAAQATISTTDLIRVALYGASDDQITTFGGGTQYVQGDTTTTPTGTVMLWKSAVSTMSPVTTSLGLPVNVIAGSLNANTEYVDGNTTTLPTGIVMLWKSAVSTLVPASTSNPFPVSSLPLTANLGTISSIATQATLAEVTTFTASTVSLLSSNKLRLENISTFTNSTNTLLLAVSSNTASSNALVSTQSITLGNISTFTNSTNTLLVQVSSNTASSNALLSTISARLAPVPTGIYVQPVAVSSNGLSTFMTLDADETEEQISATPCTVYGIWAANTGTAGAYIKLFNGTSSNIQVSNASPLIVIPIPGSSTQSLTGANYNIGGMGVMFSTACCVAAVTGAANNNTTAPAESSIICNIFYKN